MIANEKMLDMYDFYFKDLSMFSFSSYDSEKWTPITINRGEYPSYLDDGFLYLLIQDEYIYDAVIHDPQEERLQAFYNWFIDKVNTERGTSFTMKTEYNGYGSVFIYLVSTIDEKEKLFRLIEDITNNGEYLLGVFPETDEITAMREWYYDMHLLSVGGETDMTDAELNEVAVRCGYDPTE